MPKNKPHLESPAGYPAGIKQKILASDLDETGKMGSRSRLLKFAPGVYTTVPFVHDHREEVYLMSGDLIVGNDAHGNAERRFCCDRASRRADTTIAAVSALSVAILASSSCWVGVVPVFPCA